MATSDDLRRCQTLFKEKYFSFPIPVILPMPTNMYMYIVMNNWMRTLKQIVNQE